MLALCKKYFLISLITGFLFSTGNAAAETQTNTLNPALTIAHNANVTRYIQADTTTNKNPVLLSEALDFQTFQERTKQVKS